jgi:hypothetical protein
MVNELETKYLETLDRLNIVNRILKTCGGKFKEVIFLQ